MSIGVDIKDIPKVSDKDFAITLNAYFIVKWHDSRLIVQAGSTAELQMNFREIGSVTITEKAPILDTNAGWAA